MRSDHVVGWAFAFPAVALLIAIGIVPIVWSALMSFQRRSLLSTPVWIGLDNYRALPKDPLFKTSAVHAVIYAALFVPLSVGGVEVALLFVELEPCCINVSARSKGRVLIDRLARRFGGGGHPLAAGFTIKATLEQAKVLALAAASELLAKPSSLCDTA